MRRFTSMKVGLASILSCFALFLGLFATTGTASAHSAHHVDPNINVSDVSRRGNCLDFRIFGEDFSAHHHADLRAESLNGNGGDVSIDPGSVHVNGHGQFETDAEACTNFNQFSNCGTFIDNPDSFCGFNFSPNEFCGFGFEPSQFCFGNGGFGNGGGTCVFNPQFCQPFPQPGCFPPTFPPQPGCFQRPPFPPSGFGNCQVAFECGFRRIPVDEFCRFHSFSFCGFRRHRPLTIFITALDTHSDRESNTVELRVINPF